MADEEREIPRTPASADGAEEEEEDSGSTPFDHPFFLPVVLWIFAAWFGYDIVTGAQAYLDYPNFNRGGLAITGALALYFTWRAIQERRSDQ